MRAFCIVIIKCVSLFGHTNDQCQYHFCVCYDENNGGNTKIGLRNCPEAGKKCKAEREARYREQREEDERNGRKREKKTTEKRSTKEMCSNNLWVSEHGHVSSTKNNYSKCSKMAFVQYREQFTVISAIFARVFTFCTKFPLNAQLNCKYTRNSLMTILG